MQIDQSTLAALMQREAFLWLNPAYKGEAFACEPSASMLQQAQQRLVRAAPLLQTLFAEFNDSYGIIESWLQPASALQVALGEQQGQWLLKRDDALPVAGSVKARGGFHEVLAVAERLARQHGLLQDDDFMALASDKAKALFAQYKIEVGSTGNLGMSIGLMASALGFEARVHMSVDAKQWKKQRLREQGVSVVEYSGDYAAAVSAGRSKASQDSHAHFVDDEHSLMLFLGYAASGQGIADSLTAQGLEVNADHPLFVYLPCGVGGAPGGITYGLKAIFGPNVHCFFVEPVASPCMLAALANEDEQPVSVYDLGLDNHTQADGLAVGQASALVAPMMRTMLSGVVTVKDDDLFRYLALAQQTLSAKIEPSAAASVAGPLALLTSKQGSAYLAQQHIKAESITHIMWSTGGALIPDAEYQQFLRRGTTLLAQD